MTGDRYIGGVDPRWAHFARHKLPFLSFTLACETYENHQRFTHAQRRFLASIDRFYLFCFVLHRPDGVNEWVYDRSRELDADPDGHADLWARYHYKSSLITFAGSIKEIINDPEMTIGVFSADKEIATPFVEQIKRELEDNDQLKGLYPEIFYADPRRQAPLWKADRIIVRRRGNPKEATVEAQSIMKLRTGRHYRLRIYNDMVNEGNTTDTMTDQKAKVFRQWELSQSLKSHDGDRMWLEGTRYHYADAHGIIVEKGTLKERVYPATDNGRLDGEPVFLSPKAWADIKKNQTGVVAAQMLLNPVEGNQNMFTLDWARPYAIRPRFVNIYILCDPSLGKRRTSDRTAIAVIGIDANSNRYLLDGYCHRMKLSQRWAAINQLFRKWKAEQAKLRVHGIWVGYERYGMQADLEYFDEQMFIHKIEGLQIEEVSWVREGAQSKLSRIGRLEPFFRDSGFWLPPYVHHPDHGGKCSWRIGHKEITTSAGETQGGAQIIYRPYQAPSKKEIESAQRGERWRITEPLMRRDQDGNAYDLTRIFFEEFRLYPFAPHDDFLDTMSRVEDMAPRPPVVYESRELEAPTHPDT